ncbi:hypothetical protein Poli38472_002713 [Pythium oligandrum]|uniref:Endonuclease/exonuclease/phosphatase domain-containing protein n=1 Tax=Pythium oligandrum TaxID=41045 RepID=A0A8K1CI08_PYTOL|nr:hypothetical protein Poli38472_002713 [Pythium oligandrum]|eukprot:TMW63772.1 hypothetical protein Poli38472_002713 [Pythium oligandrum]
MTFNLRDSDDEEKENLWADRHDHVAEIINRYRPVVLGAQEGVLDQLDDLHDVVMPQYEHFGDARETGSEYVQVFFDTNVVEFLNGSTFRLSETPNEAESIGWDAASIRIATWCQFRLRATQQEFFFVNTQLDNKGKTARLNGAKVIWGEMKNLIPNTDKTPLFLTGDLNDMRPSDVYQFLTTDPAGPLFHDAWSVAEHAIGSVSNSYHHWLGPAYDKTKHIDWIDPLMDHPDIPGANHIDFILSRPRLPVIMTEVITEALNGQYPSDHYPIVAEYLFPSASKLPSPSN